MIRYTSENGYTGYLYGKNSMSIGIEKEDGMVKECFHTGSRAGDTFEYLKEMVDTFPQFLEALNTKGE